MWVFVSLGGKRRDGRRSGQRRLGGYDSHDGTLDEEWDGYGDRFVVVKLDLEVHVRLEVSYKGGCVERECHLSVFVKAMRYCVVMEKQS